MISFIIQTLRWLLLRNRLTYQIDPPWRKRPNLAKLVQGRDYIETGGIKEPKTKPIPLKMKPDLDKNNGGGYYKETGQTPPKKSGPTVGDLKRLQAKYPPHTETLEQECAAPVPEIAKSIIQIAEGLTGRRMYIKNFDNYEFQGIPDLYLVIVGKHFTDSGRATKIAVREGYLKSGDEARTVLIVKALKELLIAEQEYTSKDKLGRIISRDPHNLSSATYITSDSTSYGIYNSYYLGIDAGLRHKLKEIWLDSEESGSGSVRPTRNAQVRLAESSLEEEPHKAASQDSLL